MREAVSGRIMSGADGKKPSCSCDGSASGTPSIPERTFHPMTPPSSEMAGPPLYPGRIGASVLSQSPCMSEKVALNTPSVFTSVVAIPRLTSSFPQSRSSPYCWLSIDGPHPYPITTSGRPEGGGGASGSAKIWCPVLKLTTGSGSRVPSTRATRRRTARSTPAGRSGIAARWPCGGHEMRRTSATNSHVTGSPSPTATCVAEGSALAGRKSAG
mmetsp:Transcript_44033/g.100856  ORF Transcript_44033/g.100856 Transcript_44033/m.100856 type:complete len:214 (+) Transcript_44033:1720-2361(+)